MAAEEGAGGEEEGKEESEADVVDVDVVVAVRVEFGLSGSPPRIF